MRAAKSLVILTLSLFSATSSFAQEVVDTAETTAKVISNGDALTVTQTGSVIVLDDTATEFNTTDVTGDIQIDGTVESTSTASNSHALNFIDVGVDGSITINGTLQTAEGDGIDITALGKTITGSIINNGTIISDGEDLNLSGIEFELGVIEGDIINSATGSITSNGDNGIKVDGDEDTDFSDNLGILEGQLINVGTISAACEALDIDSNAWIKGGIVNTGTLENTSGSESGCDVIEIDETSRVDGGITNSGLIDSRYIGLRIEDGSLVTGDIVNNDTINSESEDGIDVDDARVEGSIINNGTILSDGEVDDTTGIEFNDGVITGDIVNSATGTITANGDNGIAIWGDGDDDLDDNKGVLEGRLINHGTITAACEAFDIDVNSWVKGGIVNTGTLENTSGPWSESDCDVIEIDEDARVNGGITNSGRIDARADGMEIEGGSLVTGDIVNNGTINSSEDDGIEVDDARVEGSIINGIDASVTGASDGVKIDGSTLTGQLINRGRIVSDDGEVFDLDSGSEIQGGFINSGTLIAKDDEIIEIDEGTRIDGGINNSGVMISEAEDGIEIEKGSLVNGGVINSGQIRADEESWDAFELKDDASINGGLTNTGLIAAKDDVLIFESASTLTGNLDNQRSGIIIGTSEIEASVNMINAGQWFIKVNADFDDPSDTGEVGEEISTVTGTYTQSSGGLLGIASEAARFSQLSVTGDVVFEASAKIHVDVKNDGQHLAVGDRLENVVQATGTLTAQRLRVLDNSPDLAFVVETDGKNLSLLVIDQPLPMPVPTLSLRGLLLLALMVLGLASVMGARRRLD